MKPLAISFSCTELCFFYCALVNVFATIGVFRLGKEAAVHFLEHTSQPLTRLCKCCFSNEAEDGTQKHRLSAQKKPLINFYYCPHRLTDAIQMHGLNFIMESMQGIPVWLVLKSCY